MDSFNLKLYQDLLTEDDQITIKTNYDPGPTRVPGIELICPDINPIPEDHLHGLQQKLRDNNNFIAKGILYCRDYLKKQDYWGADWEGASYNQCFSSKGIPSYAFFRCSKPGCEPEYPGPISSKSVDEYGAVYAFDSGSGTWQSQATGNDVVNNAYIGFNFGKGRKVKPESVDFTWYTIDYTPETLKIEASNNGIDWVEIEVFKRTGKFSEKKVFVDQNIPIKCKDAYSMWRVVPHSPLAPNLRFAITEMKINQATIR
jgi:hypothetical protein